MITREIPQIYHKFALFDPKKINDKTRGGIKTIATWIFGKTQSLVKFGRKIIFPAFDRVKMKQY